MNKQELLDGIRAERARLEQTLAAIPRDRWQEAGAVGFWSVQDVIAHLAVWASRAVTALYYAERGRDPRAAFPAHDREQGWDPSNAIAYEEQKDRPLDRIEADFHGVTAQLLKRIEAVTDARVLLDAARFAGLKGRPLSEWIWASSGGHDAEHRHDLEQWMASGAKQRTGP